jgi:hypothetical protein
MSEKEIGRALLRGEEPIDVQAMTRRVLRRDRRRVGVLSIICFAAWMGVVMVPWSVILPAMAKIGVTAAAMNGLPGAQDAQSAQRQQYMLEAAEELKNGTLLAFFTSIGSMFVAAVCTVLLIVVSRRATLRQVNARLAEISEQLGRLAVSPK